MSEKIRVLLVDDHTLFRSGIKSLLQRNEDFEVVGEAGDGLEGIKRARDAREIRSADHAKNIETDALIDAIRRAAQGESVVSQQMTAKLIQGVRNPPKAEGAGHEKDRFSPRERDILLSLAHGESNKEIARKLDLAESTVKIHVQNIFKKLNMSSRVQVALYAVEHGYAQAPHT